MGIGSALIMPTCTLQLIHIQSRRIPDSLPLRDILLPERSTILQKSRLERAEFLE